MTIGLSVKLHGHPLLNGKVEAPSATNGASALSSSQTVFPKVEIRHSAQSLFYYSNRHLFGGIPLFRWFLSLLIAVAVIWGVGSLPGRWWIAALLALLWFGALLLLSYWRNADYVHFSPMSFPSVAPARLEPSEKITLFVTGYLAVENKEQRFTWLPGFFRTFATREHALMCFVAPGSRIGIGHWPDDEIGLWYLFFQPHEISSLRWGRLTFGQTTYPALALTYQRHIPRRSRFRPERTINETVYLATTTEEEGKQIIADLLYDEVLQPEQLGELSREP